LRLKNLTLAAGIGEKMYLGIKGVREKKSWAEQYFIMF